MPIDRVNHASREGTTETKVQESPHLGEHKRMLRGTELPVGLQGKPMFIDPRVTILNEPLATALVNVWHADRPRQPVLVPHDSVKKLFHPDEGCCATKGSNVERFGRARGVWTLFRRTADIIGRSLRYYPAGD
ncbi:MULTISPECIES: hypothetical protein [unclassified Bradyrhizobium]|nr:MULTISPECIES: hypothetical protein [unclassified Bradyrhizobium]WGR73151.1 hypothetical protein MTX24_10095 [Bradyrhizobium sp. ISRA426]WGR77991.1 hypothetical protein MTX21_35065 [Bradyrhizobium sp. ISRA430]WGR88392.1 hypothetical protein MTX25_10105 [Bradyrhizobium sp. ISRA432]